MSKFTPPDSCEDMREEYEKQISELTDQISSLEDMNKTLEKKLKRQDGLLGEKIAQQLREIDEWEQKALPTTDCGKWMNKHITGRGIFWLVVLLVISYLLIQGVIKLSELTEAVKAIK